MLNIPKGRSLFQSFCWKDFATPFKIVRPMKTVFGARFFALPDGANLNLMTLLAYM